MVGGKKDEAAKLNVEMEQCRDNAIWNFKKTIEINPTYDFGHNNLGVCYARRGQDNLAMPQFEAALRFNQSYADAYSNLCSLLVKHGQYARAAYSGEQAVKIRPDRAGDHVNLGLAYEGLHRRQEAQTQYQIAVQLDPYGPNNFMAYFQLARSLIQANDFKGAAVCLEKEVQLQPGHVSGWIQLAVVYGKLGEWTKAETAAASVVRISPQQPAYQQFLEMVRAHRLPEMAPAK